MSHHVHSTDTKHGSVHIVAMEHVIHEMISVLLIKKNFLLVLLSEIISAGNKESRGSASRIADKICRLRVHHFNHHADNMSRGSELAVNTGLRYFREKILINISADICLMKLLHHGIDLVHGIHDL